MPFDNDFFEDPFDEIIKDFFGKSPFRSKRSMIIEGEEEDRNIDFTEDENYVYLIFELPGYTEKDVDIAIKGRQLEIRIKKKRDSSEVEGIQSYLNQKLHQGIIITKNLPKFINTKNFKHTMKNGVLEIVFSKK